jgi:hypothetical protein
MVGWVWDSMRGNIAIYIAIYIMVNLLRENANDISSLYLADIYIYIYIMVNFEKMYILVCNSYNIMICNYIHIMCKYMIRSAW